MPRIQELDALIKGAPQIEQWMVDTLWMCNLDDAIQAKRDFAERNLRFFECPLQPEDLSWTPHRLQRSRRMPHRHRRTFPHDISTHRLAETRERVRHLPARHRPNQHQRLHPSTRSRIFLRHSRSHHTWATVSRCSKPQHSNAPPYRRPQLLQEFQGGLSNLLQDASDTGWQLKDGAFHLPDRPGIGVTIDQDGIEPYTVRH